MPTVDHLLHRLDAIAHSLQTSGHGLALLALGSVGLERDRLDEYSDLDFFAIVHDGHKHAFIEDLDWLARVHPVAYAFQNTVDGHKLLFADGVFCEFAVFEPHELSHIPFAEGHIVWQADGFDAALLQPQPQSAPQTHTIEWHVGEALTNLYVGLSRLRRGEVLSAQRFIQHYAVDRIVALAPLIEQADSRIHADLFAGERRFEQRYPSIAEHLPDFVQGYDRSIESARAILAFLEQHFEVNAAMRDEILRLCV